MAYQELTSKNPFMGGIGIPVYGERFIGRKHLVQQLREDCTRKSHAIHGLPHTGKTSLVQHSIMQNAQLVETELPLCVIYVRLDTCKDCKELYREIATKSYETVRELLTNDDDIRVLDSGFQLLEKKDFITEKFKGFFVQYISSLKVHLTIILDRFDHIRKKGFGFESTDFSILSSIIAPTNITFVVISIRSLNSLENEVGKEAGSVFSQLFLSATIVLKQFSDTELENYWTRLTPYFENIGLKLNKDYQTEATYYAGNDPYLLDAYNDLIYSKYKSGVGISPEEIRLAMHKIYDSYIRLLERENLLSTAIQAILGPVYDLDEYKMGLLQQLDFIRTMGEDEKLTLVGHSMGQIDIGPNKTYIAYVAKTDYFTKLFRQDYLGRADFWKEWSATFRSLQLLCLDFLVAKWGDKWEDHVEVEAIREMRKDQKKDRDAQITASDNLIDYLRESYIGDLIEKYWDIFAPVFAPIQKYTFSNHYYIIRNLRNHYAHNNTRFLTDEDRARANAYLEEIGKKVNAWHQSGQTFQSEKKDTQTENTPSPLPEIKREKDKRTPPPPPAPATQEPRVKLNNGEYLGQMKLFRKQVYIKNPEPCTKPYIFIDRESGYRFACSPKEIDYEENQWVVCKLRQQLMRDGVTFYFAIDIHPAEDN